MRINRLAFAGAALAAVIGLSGCGQQGGDTKGGATTGGGAPAAASPTPTQDPAAELAAAATALGKQPTKMKMNMAATMSGAGYLDQTGKRANMTMSIAAAGEKMQITVRQVGNLIYMKFGGSYAQSFGSKWMSLDASKLPATSQLSVDNSLDTSKNFIKVATKVEKVGAGSFTGTLDLTKSPTYQKSTGASLAEKMKAVPFTAKVDSEGRLTDLVVDMDAIGAGAIGKMTVQYYDFGVSVPVAAPPAAQVTPMPAELLAAMSKV